MAKSLNRVALIGNLGQDPDLKFMPNGGAVCNLSIACSESYKDKNTGEIIEKTEWIRLTAFRKLAEICGEYLKKGSKIYVDGKFTTDKYEKNGVDHYASKVIIDNMLMLDSRGQGGGGQSVGANNSQSNPNQSQAGGATQSGGFDDFDDDIPF